MTNQNLNRPKIHVKYTRIFEKNFKSTARTVVNVGGARSSKSHSLAQLMIMKAVKEQGKNIGIGRKTFPALRMTAYRVFIDLLKEYKLYKPEHHNMSASFYELNGNRIQFFSLDEPDKIKSTEFNYVWMEEANEFTKEDYLIILTRLSGKVKDGERNQIFLSLNPSDVGGWIRGYLINQPDVEVIHSTFLDNPFLPSDYKQVLENLKDTDPNAYAVYARGEWAQLKDTVYTEYNYAEAMPEGLEQVIYGLDFGYTNPSAMVKIGVKENNIYVQEILYKSNLTGNMIVEELRRLNINPADYIYADAAEPDKIAEIVSSGLNCYPANKSVKDGIDAVKRFKLHIVKGSDNLINEIKSYRWKKDRNDNIFEEPVKFNDHALDALRYAVYTHLSNINRVSYFSLD